MSICECPPSFLHLPASGANLSMSSCKLTVDRICCMIWYVSVAIRVMQSACASCRNTEPISSGNRGLFAFVFALLIVPAGIILAIAFSSGYMVRSLRIHTWVLVLLVQRPRYSLPDNFTLIDSHEGCYLCKVTVKGCVPSNCKEVHAVQDTISNGVQQ